MRRSLSHRTSSVLTAIILLVTEAFRSSPLPRISSRGGAGQSRCMIGGSRVGSPPDLERDIVSLGKSGHTDEALDMYFSVSKPSIRLLNGAIDACSRARPPRLEQAFDLLADGLEKKNLKPNVFTFGALVSACSRARKADLAIDVLRSMEVSSWHLHNAIVRSKVAH
jgi:pentatricopeptide repeat protein